MTKFLSFLITALKALKRVLFAEACPHCGAKDMYFTREMHFYPGSPDLYYCDSCKEFTEKYE